MTAIAIDGEDWLIDNAPTYSGRTFRGWRIEGLLLNSRMANGVFDDENPLTRHLWAYPRKHAFFDFRAEVTGTAGLDRAPARRTDGIDR
jgi:hypothetical protein